MLFGKNKIYDSQYSVKELEETIESLMQNADEKKENLGRGKPFYGKKKGNQYTMMLRSSRFALNSFYPVIKIDVDSSADNQRVHIAFHINLMEKVMGILFLAVSLLFDLGWQLAEYGTVTLSLGGFRVFLTAMISAIASYWIFYYSEVRDSIKELQPLIKLCEHEKV